MADSRESESPPRATCWINKTMVRMAKEIAAREGITLSETIERDLNASLRRRYSRLFGVSAEEIGESGA